MALRKLAADQIFDGYTTHAGKMLIVDDTGMIIDLASDDGTDEVERHAGLLSPGFINVHCHLELSHMKGLIPERTGLVDFVLTVVTQRHFSEDIIIAAIEKAENEMLQNGIVAVGDICNNTLTIPQKQKQRLAYYNFIEVSGWLPGVAEKRFEHSLKIFEVFSSMVNGPSTMDHASLSPHAPYSVSKELWQLLAKYQKGKTITLHNQETAHEDELFLKGTGDLKRLYQQMNIDDGSFVHPECRSLECSLPHLKDARNIILVHNTFTTEDDILSAHQHISTSSNLFWCFCPNANMYIEGVLPNVPQFIQHKQDIVLGTDSLASNWGLDLLTEMRMINKHYPGISLEAMLSWATMNGAKALQMEKQFGSFEKGKRPGVKLIKDHQDIQQASLINLF